MTAPAKSLAVYDLERRLARLKGELHACEARAAELRSLILHVGETLKLYASDPDAIRPVQPCASGRWFKRGDGSRSVLGILRTAQKPLSAREIENRLLALYELDERARSAVQPMVRYALRRHSDLLASEGERPRRWALLP